MDERIRILFMSASPTNSGRIRVDVEVRNIAEKLKQGSARHFFKLIQCPAVRAGDLQLHLMEHKPHIVHFSGHGSRSGKILLEDEDGSSKPIKPEALKAIFELHKKNIQVVVLNACFTLEQALAIGETIDFTVGISKTIKDKAAITFAGAFYRALSFEMTVQEAFDSGRVELMALNVRGHEALEFIVRPGANPSETILSPTKQAGTSRAHIWKIALSRLAAGLATRNEVASIRQDMLDGRLMLDKTEGEGDDTDDSIKAVRSVGDERSFHAEVSPSTYRRIQEHLYPPPPGLPPPPPGLIFIGRESSLAHFKPWLQAVAPRDADVNLKVVRGWPGVGKTTLVGVLGRDPEVFQAFPDGVLWTSLERQPEIMNKLAEWARTLGAEDFLRIHSSEEATAKLAAMLGNRRMLLIVDDVWDAADAFPFIRSAVGTRCAVLVTTRLTGVAETLALDEKSIYVLPVLTDDSAIKLLRHIIPGIVDRYPEECLQLARDLECLPLALHVAGRLLKSEEKIGLSVTDLIKAISQEGRLLSAEAPLDRAEAGRIPTVQALLKKSTDVLDPLSRDCFAFLGVFAPKPATFDLGAIKAVWDIPKPDPIIRNLVRHGLLESVSPGRFQIHDLLVQHARSIID